MNVPSSKLPSSSARICSSVHVPTKLSNSTVCSRAPTKLLNALLRSAVVPPLPRLGHSRAR
eukprot:371462-Pyramimonas_sp.AAC.1